VAQDLELFERALALLGVHSRFDGEVLRLSPDAPAAASAEIFCGNAGTMYRFVTASLTTIEGEWLVTGTPRLQERPVGALVDALRNLGADITYVDRSGYAPLRIRGGSLAGGRTEIDAQESSQFLSAVLMAATRAKHATEIDVLRLSSSPYLDLTLDAIAVFGGAVEGQDGRHFVVRPTELEPPRLVVEGFLRVSRRLRGRGIVVSSTCSGRSAPSFAGRPPVSRSAVGSARGWK
jgi:3-phosphoshikimate 1-carboxyvinyltransferase